MENIKIEWLREARAALNSAQAEYKETNDFAPMVAWLEDYGDSMADSVAPYMNDHPEMRKVDLFRAVHNASLAGYINIK